MRGGTGGDPCYRTSPSRPRHRRRAGHRPPPPPAPRPLGAQRGSRSTRNASPGPSSSWGARRGKPVTAAATQLPGDPTDTGTPGCPVPPTHAAPIAHRRGVIGSGAVQSKARGAGLCCPPRDPAPPMSPHPTSACSRSLAQGGPGDTPRPGHQRAKADRQIHGIPPAAVPGGSPPAPAPSPARVRSVCLLFLAAS